MDELKPLQDYQVKMLRAPTRKDYENYIRRALGVVALDSTVADAESAAARAGEIAEEFKMISVGYGNVGLSLHNARDVKAAVPVLQHLRAIGWRRLGSPQVSPVAASIAWVFRRDKRETEAHAPTIVVHLYLVKTDDARCKFVESSRETVTTEKVNYELRCDDKSVTVEGFETPGEPVASADIPF